MVVFDGRRSQVWLRVRKIGDVISVEVTQHNARWLLISLSNPC